MRVGKILKAIWNSIRSFVHAHPYCISFAMGITGTALLLYPIDKEFWSGVWNWFSEGESNSGTIRNIGLVLAGLVALPLALWRSLVAQRQAEAAQRQAFTAQEGLANDRYQKGAEMLGSDILSVRVGGIYALRGLVEDVPSIYMMPVQRLLCAFIRNPTEDSSLLVNDKSANVEAPPLRDDVKAALEVVTDRRAGEVERERKRQITHDIVRSQLQRSALIGTNFANFNLSSVDFTDSLLGNADFSYAILAFANLSGAELGNANFYHATLYGCDLSGAKFTSDAMRSDLSIRNIVACNLTQAQLDQAVAAPDNPPILDGVVDAETGEQLVWRGSAPSE